MSPGRGVRGNVRSVAWMVTPWRGDVPRCGHRTTGTYDGDEGPGMRGRGSWGQRSPSGDRGQGADDRGGVLWVSSGVGSDGRDGRTGRAGARRGWRRAGAALGVVMVAAGAATAGWYALSDAVEVLADGQQRTIRTFAGDVGEVLGGLGVAVGPDDRVSPSPDTPVADGLRVEVRRAWPIEVQVDDEAHRLATTADTVEGALRVAGVELGEHDLVDPSLDRRLDGPTVISVRRVTTITDVVESVVEHGEQREQTDGLPAGQTQVGAEGAPGLRRETYEVTLIDGEEAQRNLVADEVVTEPVDRVVLEGTGPGPLEQAQARLADLGYPVGPVDGIEGGQTRRALCAWRRLEGRDVSRQGLQPGELDALRASSGLPAAAAGRGVTADRTCQAVYFRQDGRWQHVHRASTGADGLPRPGDYQVQWARPGWHTSTLYPADTPNMYNALYIRGAIAIHGSRHVPPYPASAGCVRVTPAAADQLFAALSVGDPVSVVGTY